MDDEVNGFNGEIEEMWRVEEGREEGGGGGRMEGGGEKEFPLETYPLRLSLSI